MHKHPTEFILLGGLLSMTTAFSHLGTNYRTEDIASENKTQIIC